MSDFPEADQMPSEQESTPDQSPQYSEVFPRTFDQAEDATGRLESSPRIVIERQKSRSLVFVLLSLLIVLPVICSITVWKIQQDRSIFPAPGSDKIPAGRPIAKDADEALEGRVGSIPSAGNEARSPEPTKVETAPPGIASDSASTDAAASVAERPKDEDQSALEKARKVFADDIQKRIAEGKNPAKPDGEIEDIFKNETVWRGTKSFREGGYAPLTVEYELHVEERRGRWFTGYKFNKGAGRNRAEVQGTIEGKQIKWQELSDNGRTRTTMKGTIDGSIISLTFEGIFANGLRSTGDAILFYDRNNQENLGNPAVRNGPVFGGPVAGRVVPAPPIAGDIVANKPQGPFGEREADRLQGNLAGRPLPMDQLREAQHEMLHKELDEAIGLAKREIPDGQDEAKPAGPEDALGVKNVWSGERTYRQGAYAVKTVSYHLHVLDRKGNMFFGVKFDNGLRRNIVNVEGWVVGERISWIEIHKGSVLHINGLIKDGKIALKFSGQYEGGQSNSGAGHLTLTPGAALYERPDQVRREEPAGCPIDQHEVEGGEGPQDKQAVDAGRNEVTKEGSRPAITVIVPGTANPYLADAANGAGPADATDGTVPPSVDVEGGSTLKVTVTGGVKNAPQRAIRTPDGGPNVQMVPAYIGGRGRISSWNLPLGMAAGIFVNNEVKDEAKPEPYTGDLASPEITPLIGQVFPIGDGLTGDGVGTRQVVRVPAGAKKLYLAAIDGFRWGDNGGQFEVAIEAQKESVDKKTGVGLQDKTLKGTVWKGEKRYREGAFAGNTVAYELHISERTGQKFVGFKFENGPDRNRAEAEGTIEGNTITWAERGVNHNVTLKGTITGNKIDVHFDGVFSNGVPCSGNATLIHGGLDDLSIKQPGEKREDLERQANELYQDGVRLSEGRLPNQAKIRFEQSIALLKKITNDHDHPGLVANYRQIALIMKENKNYDSAIDNFEQALKMQNRLTRNQPTDLSLNLVMNIAVCWSRKEEHARALEYHLRSLQMHEQINNNNKLRHIAILGNIGNASSSLGENAQALKYFKQMLEISREINGSKPNLELCKHISMVASVYLTQGEVNLSLQLNMECLEKLKELTRGADHPDLAACLYNISVDLYRLHDVEHAMAHRKQSLEMSERLFPGQDRFELARILDGMAVGMFELGSFDQAQSFCQRALNMRERLYPIDQFPNGHGEVVQDLSFMGEILHAQGQKDQARPLLERALTMRNNLLFDNFSHASEAQALNFAHHFSSSGFRNLLISSNSDNIVLNNPYDKIWMLKAQVSRMTMLCYESLRRSSDPASHAIARDLSSIRHQLAVLLLASTDSATVSRSIKAKLESLVAARERLERQLRSHLPDLRRKLESDNQSSRAISQNLPKNCAFIDMIVYGDYNKKENGLPFAVSLIAFVICPGQEPIPVLLGPSEPMERAVREWRRQIIEGVRPDSEALESRTVLRSLIWDKIEPFLPPHITTVLISPDSTLVNIPWGALPGRKPTELLLENYALAIVPSGQYLMDWLRQKRGLLEGPGKLLTVGDVDYNRLTEDPAQEANEGNRIASRVEKRGVWPGLDATRGEIDAIAKLAGPRTVIPLTGVRATPQAVIDNLPDIRWAHLATHGFFATPQYRINMGIDNANFETTINGIFQERFSPGRRSPMSISGLVLTGANLRRPLDEAGLPQGDGGMLTAESIEGLAPRNLELVVLSACETGLGDTDVTEGVFGLQRAFHNAGASNVVGSLWKVKSQATSILMQSFYRKLWVDHLSPIKALQEAQLELYRHPELIANSGGANQGQKPDASRGPDLSTTVTIVDEKGVSKSVSRTPVRYWAGFMLSGLGN